jgi:tRNA threonylcarbamoyladenosine biosynthesis protein TsaB
VVENGFKSLNLKQSDLKAIAVAQGPGSYTGIRVGAAAGKGLAYFKSIPLVGYCSLEGFISEKEGRFASVIDAGIGGSYVLLQKREGELITLLSQPQLIAAEILESYLADYPDRVGPTTHSPDPSHIARLTLQKLAQGTPTHDLSLIYLRTPEYKKSPFA